MATTLYFNMNTPTTVKPTTRRYALGTGYQLLTNTLGGGQDTLTTVYPVAMSETIGGSKQTASLTASEPGAAHNVGCKTFVSKPLAAQTISGTFTYISDITEGNVNQNTMPSLYIYIMNGSDLTVRGVLYAGTPSGTEAGTSEAATTYFSATALTSQTSVAGDALVIEVFNKDNSTKTASYAHAFYFNGASPAHSLVTFNSVTFTWNPTSVSVSDAIGASDALLRHKALPIADTIGFTDAVSKIRQLSITDTVGLVDALLRHKTTQLADTVGLADALLRHKTTQLADAITLNEVRVLTLNATANDAGDWTNPQNAYSDDGVYATIELAHISSGLKTDFKTFGITTPTGTPTIRAVEINARWWETTVKGHLWTEISWDGGTNWSAQREDMSSPDSPGVDFWTNVTEATAWTWMKLNDANLKVRVGVDETDEGANTFYLDVAQVRITYDWPISINKSMPLSDTLHATDAPLAHKTIVMTESFGLADTQVRGKGLVQLDTLNLLDAIVVDMGTVLKSISDALTADDMVLVDKLITILDAISYADGIVVDTGVVTPPVEEQPVIPAGRITRRKTVKTKKGKGARLLPRHIVITDAVGFTDELLISISDFLTQDSFSFDDSRIAVFKQLHIVDSLNLHEVVRAHKRIVLLEAIGLAEEVMKDVTRYIHASEDEIALIIKQRALEATRELRLMLSRSRNTVAKKLRVEGMKDPAMMNKAMVNYEKKLVALFTDFKRSLPKALMLLSGATDARELVEYDAERAKEELGALVQVVILDPARKPIDSQMKTVYTSGAKRADQFLKGVGVQASFKPMATDAAALDVLDTRNMAALEGITDDMSKSIMAELTDGLLKGIGPMEIAKNIDEQTDIGITRARVMTRTETMYAFNTGLTNEYASHGIEAVEWLAAYDERVCEECSPLMGKKFPIDEAPDCPLHPQCRCTLLPVIPEV